jgi:PAS domain S-box-containing protein
VTVAQKDIELILLRQWASQLTLPIFLIDANGQLLFYNEAAETLLGMRFDEAGEMPLERLSTIFQTTDEDGQPIASDELAIGVALLQRRLSHRVVRLRGLDGSSRRVEVTAIPLTGQGGRNLGAVSFFWETPP